MQSRYLKPVAYNDRIIQAEKEIAAINADIPEFLSQMTLDPSDQVVVVVNGSEEMKRDEEAFAGQLWRGQPGPLLPQYDHNANGGEGSQGSQASRSASDRRANRRSLGLPRPWDGRPRRGLSRRRS
jgi:hypothetical protein